MLGWVPCFDRVVFHGPHPAQLVLEIRVELKLLIPGSRSGRFLNLGGSIWDVLERLLDSESIFSKEVTVPQDQEVALTDDDTDLLHDELCGQAPVRVTLWDPQWEAQGLSLGLVQQSGEKTDDLHLLAG